MGSRYSMVALLRRLYFPPLEHTKKPNIVIYMTNQ